VELIDFEKGTKKNYILGWGFGFYIIYHKEKSILIA
jgi:hypothetical protein